MLASKAIKAPLHEHTINLLNKSTGIYFLVVPWYIFHFKLGTLLIVSVSSEKVCSWLHRENHQPLFLTLFLICHLINVYYSLLSIFIPLSLVTNNYPSSLCFSNGYEIQIVRFFFFLCFFIGRDKPKLLKLAYMFYDDKQEQSQWLTL